MSAYHAARLQRAANRRLDRTAALTAELERERIASYGSRSLWTQLRLQALAARRDAWHALAGGDVASALEYREEFWTALLGMRNAALDDVLSAAREAVRHKAVHGSRLVLEADLMRLERAIARVDALDNGPVAQRLMGAAERMEVAQ